MMNNPFVIDQARAMVAKPEFQEPQAYERQVHELYECAFARKAEPAEVDAGLRFVNTVLTAPPLTLSSDSDRAADWLLWVEDGCK